MDLGCAGMYRAKRKMGLHATSSQKNRFAEEQLLFSARTPRTIFPNAAFNCLRTPDTGCNICTKHISGSPANSAASFPLIPWTNSKQKFNSKQDYKTKSKLHAPFSRYSNQISALITATHQPIHLLSKTRAGDGFPWCKKYTIDVSLSWATSFSCQRMQNLARTT